jgi:hypothetical protein
MIYRSILLTLLVSLSSHFGWAQNWTQNLPESKSESKLTLYDYKKAFDTYWEPYNVKNGYYTENGKELKAAGWKQFLRWHYEMEGQVNKSDGSFPDKTAQEIYNEYIKNHQFQKTSVSANWTSIGPDLSDGGYAGIGRINNIAFHPNDNNTWWIAAPAGGVWLTTDNGQNWTCLTDENGVLGVSDIAIPSDYSSSQTIYIATGDRNAWHNRSIGVLKSTDAGTTWNPTDIQFALADFQIVSRLLMDPNNDQTILAATSSGLFKTTNGGSNWSNQLSEEYFIDMEYKPGDFNTLYGSTTDGEIWISSNGGADWSLSHSQGDRIELAVSPADPNVVYAIAANGAGGLFGVYQSTNSGNNFNMVFNGNDLNLLHWNADGSGSGGQGWYDLAIAVSLTDPNLLLVGGVNTWRSTNGGVSWSIVNHWWGDGVQAVHADKHMLKYRSNGDLFECNDGGVYVSNNDGTSWVDKTDGIVISQIYKLGVSQTVPNETIIGLQDNGTKLFSNGSWADVRGGDGMECLIDYTNTDVQYATVYYGDIRRTINHWNSSVPVTPTAAGDGAWVTPFIFSPTNNETIYAGYANVWKTTDRGNSWTEISSMNSGSKLRSLAIAPSNDQVVYAADQNKIWKTTNDGGSWVEVTSNLPVSSTNITSIAVKDNDPNTLWVSLSGYNSHGVYSSTDGGNTWMNLSEGLPELPVYNIIQNKQSIVAVHLYVATELGVYFKNGTNDWVPFNEGLPNVRSSELEIYYATNPDNSRLRLSTFGRGLWETTLETETDNLPLVETATPLNITTTSANLGGEVLEEGADAVFERGIVYSNSPNPTTDDFKVVDGDGGLGDFSLFVAGLSSGSLYYTRAYAINSSGTSYGLQEMFTTTCLFFTLPLDEDFEANNFPPDCWRTFIGFNGLGNLNNWTTTADAQNGSKAAFVQSENVQGGLAQDWLVAPAIQAGPESQLNFYQKQGSAANLGNDFIIMVSTTSQTAISDFSILEQWSEEDFSTDYTEKTIDLSSFEGEEIFIAFVMEHDNGDDWYIDNIKFFNGTQPIPIANIEALPDCNTGTVKVLSNLSGVQTFFLTDSDGNVLDEETMDATFFDFEGITNGTYRGKVEKGEQMSDLTNPIELLNFTAPDQPSEISGISEPCAGSEQTYTVVADANASSYTWSLPADWTGSSISNTISVTVGNDSGEITVIPTNSCGNGPNQSLLVNVMTMPNQPGAINGINNPCIGFEEQYSVEPQQDAEFNWSIPSGWSGSSNSNTISLTVGNNPGAIEVYAFNECGESVTSSLDVDPVEVLQQLGSISGPSMVIETGIEEYSVEPLTDAQSYIWTLQNFWEIIGDDTENEVIISFNLFSESGDLSVKAINQCGGSETSTMFIQVDPVSVNDLQLETISVYPNPVQESVFIRFNETISQDVSLHFFNFEGKLMFTNQLSAKESIHKIDVSDYPAGNYFIELNNTLFSAKYQIVIQ